MTTNRQGGVSGPRLSRAERELVRRHQWLVIGLMAVMATLVLANVVARYGFGYAIIWVEELTQYVDRLFTAVAAARR